MDNSQIDNTPNMLSLVALKTVIGIITLLGNYINVIKKVYGYEF